MLPALRASLRAHRTLVWAAVLFLVALALAFMPLFDVLGFELAFVVALVASFATADLGAMVVRRQRHLGVVAAWATGAAVGLALLVVPLLVITLNGVRVRVCDYGQGLVFYALLPGLSVLVAAAAGTAAQTLLPGRLGAVCAWLVIVASIVIAVGRFVATPPVFVYEPFAGFFPGTLYDENIRLGPAFFGARAEQAAVCALALALAAAVKSRGGRRLAAAVIALFGAAVALVLRLHAADLGYIVTADDLRERMARIDTPHFSIYYTRGAAFADEMPAIAREHELRLAQVVAFFGVAPSAKITSFYFASTTEKARWMGAENTYIAKPWRHEIYLSHEEFPHGSLRHELAHVVAGEFGDPLFHVSVKWWAVPPLQFNVGLIEGAAVAADWPTGARLTPHEAVRAMLDLDLLPPLRAILAPGFFGFSSAQSYTTAGSFCRFLVERYGQDKFRSLYRAGGTAADFAAIYGRTLADLETEWRAFLALIVLRPGEVEVARERFRKRSIFNRPCPHVLAEREEAARTHLAEGEPGKAVRIFSQICEDDPGEPARKLALALALERDRRPAEAEALYRAVGADESLSTPLRAQALLRLVDLLGASGRFGDAAAPLAGALRLPVEDATRRNLVVRQEALAETALAPSALAEALRRYLFARTDPGADIDPMVLLERAHDIAAAAPDEGLGRYLAGRLLYARLAFPEAASELAAARRVGHLAAEVARENDRLLAAAAWLAGDADLCRAAAERMRSAPDPQTHRQGEDWLARVAFGMK